MVYLDKRIYDQDVMERFADECDTSLPPMKKCCVLQCSRLDPGGVNTVAVADCAYRSPVNLAWGGEDVPAAPAQHWHIVSNIWRAFCFTLLVQQDLDTNSFLEVHWVLSCLIWKDRSTVNPGFKKASCWANVGVAYHGMNSVGFLVWFCFLIVVREYVL